MLFHRTQVVFYQISRFKLCHCKRLEVNAVQSERDKQKTTQKKENQPTTRSKE